MTETGNDDLGVAIFTTVHVTEGTSITVKQRPGEGIYLLAFGTERFELELDEGVISALADALAGVAERADV